MLNLPLFQWNNPLGRRTSRWSPSPSTTTSSSSISTTISIPSTTTSTSSTPKSTWWTSIIPWRSPFPTRWSSIPIIPSRRRRVSPHRSSIGILFPTWSSIPMSHGLCDTLIFPSTTTRVVPSIIVIVGSSTSSTIVPLSIPVFMSTSVSAITIIPLSSISFISSVPMTSISSITVSSSVSISSSVYISACRRRFYDC
jgi:hypothetical protein